MDAQGTSRWRFELWHQIIEQHLIKNWWVGDGFGARVEDIMRRAWLRQTGAEFEEQFLASGGYHSGPLTAIRYVGIIGLILLYILSIAGAIYSYKTVQRCRGTPLHPAAVFVAMQLIWDPIHYAFVFGGYDGYLPDVITLLGVLRLLMRCCDEGLVVPARESTVVPAVVSATTGALA